MKFYRYELIQYASIDSEAGYGNSLINFPRRNLLCHEYNLFKETPKGYWIGHGNIGEGSLRSEGHWVSKTAKKRYAYPTKTEALNNYILRTKKRKKILYGQIDSCSDGLALAEKELSKLN